MMPAESCIQVPCMRAAGIRQNSTLCSFQPAGGHNDVLTKVGSKLIPADYRVRRERGKRRGTGSGCTISLPAGSYCSKSSRTRQKIVQGALTEQPLTSANQNVQTQVQAILFDMDGVLCNSEELSRSTAVTVLEELYGVKAKAEDFIPFAGMGEAKFLGGVARKYGTEIDIAATKRRFFEIYLDQAADPDYKIGYPGAVDMVRACRKAGLRTAVASSADRVKVDANLKAAGFDAASDFDAIISADKFELLKPAPDIFLAAAEAVQCQPGKCIVIEDAPAGIQAARAAGALCIGVTTSLSHGEIRAQSPDAVYKQIGSISIENLFSLQKQSTGILHSKQGDQNKALLTQRQKGWLDEQVVLPGDYKTSRRELLKFFPLLGALGSAYALSQNQKTLSYVSPRAILKAFLPEQKPPQSGEADTGNAKVAAFERYIADKERRGALEEVPEFPARLSWFNSSPLRLDRELKGKVLIYDFWTYCCINCIHILPALSALEQRYEGEPVAIIGVHSAKFENEKDDENIRNAVMRYEIRHPCVNDGEMTLWRELGISSWPTLAIVSPRGRLIAALPGEGQEEVVDSFIQAALSYYGKLGELDSTPLPTALEQDKDSRLSSSPLRYPSKLAADIPGGRLFISDSNNNRIVTTDLQGKFIHQVGGNGPTLRDGSFEEAGFSRPQGLAFASTSNSLYVADTENHALRKIDLGTGQVRTVAGNGQKGGDYVGGGKGRNQQLNSPWDLTFDAKEEALYIALAGQHQIWRHDLSTGATGVFSGDGAERNSNGSSGPRSSWAQPSGLSLSSSGAELVVADSESSCIRSMSLQNGASQAIVGGDPIFSDNLFRFGNQDGEGSNARLQHPLAVCSLGGTAVLVADSYNHQLKLLNTSRSSIKTLVGSGKAGFADGTSLEAGLSEPGGLARGPDGTVFVADTNNHLVRVLEPDQKQLRTLQLQGVPPPRKAAGIPADGQTKAVPPGAVLVSLDPMKASNGFFRVRVSLPQRHHLTKGANSQFEVSTSQPGAIAFEPASGALDEQYGEAVMGIQFRRSDAADAQLNAKVYYCLDEGVCLYQEIVFQMLFTHDCEGNAAVELNHRIAAQAQTDM